MIRRSAAILALLAAAAGAGVALTPLGAALGTEGATQFSTVTQAREALDAARQQQRNARARGERLESQAAQSREAADRALQEAAALAARVQQSEASIAAAEAQLALVRGQRRALDRNLAQRREPLVQLTGALQSIARRPLTLSALQPGSLRDLVHTRAVLDSTIPIVKRRTAALRGELERARILEGEAAEALVDRRESEMALARRRTELSAAAERQRLAAQQAEGGATREARRALVLAEEARDLDSLVGQLEVSGSLRKRLAALPGPIPRPENPAKASVSDAPAPVPSATAPPARYQLPVDGRVAAGFGEAGNGGPREAGIELLARPGAQVVAPGAGRVAFAGPYRGYGQIAIIEHANGWTSLVTGLATLHVAVGQSVTAGSPLGVAPRGAASITLELRRDGTPVNPLDHLQ
ncbi:murein hydrolase activator EnvC family protein [Qipengyuania zhejiangensis]|uniref:murein hydrolase activator EnvC family protein n=1 Tax=Qipengyuania zhejiangensis TaxID=3077782 RepID=UPI002D76D59F|nr:peptidoglycan DD-metalloendopeptidase family protein [Qipengyuania sp. Z2]